MKITQKFFLLGIIPALAQSLICLQMFSLLSSVEYLAKKEAREIAVHGKLVQGITDFIAFGSAANSFVEMPAKESAADLRAGLAAMDRTLAELRSLSAEYPDLKRYTEDMIDLGASTRVQFLAYKGVSEDAVKIQEAELPEAKASAFRTGRAFADRLKKCLAILALEDSELKQTRANLDAGREQVKCLVIIELALCIAFVAVMYLLFRFDFGKRFNALMSIARDMAIDKQPALRVTGKDELAELSTALLRASDARLEAVAEKQMLYQMVTHDLRSPLMAASLVVETLLRELASLNAEAVGRLHSLERSLKTVVGLTNDLLTVEKLSAGGIEITRVKVDFRETIDQAIEMVSPLAESKACRIENQSPRLVVLIDEDRILQVTVNLLSNAIKFSPQAGEVTVKAAVEDNWLRVEIMDRGPGIEEKDSQRLFNPFQQGASGYKAGGFGLGLTISRLLVELHDGNIGAMPRPGGGSIFWYTLRLTNQTRGEP